jgi:quinol monooxygenase YgiN
VIAFIDSFRVKPDQRDRFLVAAEDDSTGALKQEPGCLRFEVDQDQGDAYHFHFYEVYRDEAAFEAHCRQPYFAQMLEVASEALAEPPQITRVHHAIPA